MGLIGKSRYAVILLTYYDTIGYKTIYRGKYLSYECKHIVQSQNVQVVHCKKWKREAFYMNHVSLNMLQLKSEISSHVTTENVIN